MTTADKLAASVRNEQQARKRLFTLEDGFKALREKHEAELNARTDELLQARTELRLAVSESTRLRQALREEG